jgi:hypothetical protein
MDSDDQYETQRSLRTERCPAVAGNIIGFFAATLLNEGQDTLLSDLQNYLRLNPCSRQYKTLRKLRVEITFWKGDAQK